MEKLKYLFSILFVLVIWVTLSFVIGEKLFPGPITVGLVFFDLIREVDSYEHLLITFFRGVVGVTISLTVALVLGVPCGLNRKIMNMLSPLVVASQGCPSIIWISLLMVWVGMGSVIPIVVIIVSIFPLLFFNIAQGVSSLDPALFKMAKLYKVNRFRILKDIIFPGITSYLVASLSYALGVGWKIISTAEFLGASNGIGSKLYWSYRYLNIPELFCWAGILIMLGFSLEYFVIRKLREKYLKLEQRWSTDD